VDKNLLLASGFSTGAAGSFAVAEANPLAQIQSSSMELMKDALAQYGKSIFKQKNIKKLEAFLKSSPKYQTLQNRISELPKWLAKDLGKFYPSARGSYANARFFKQQIVLPFYKPQAYCDRFGQLLTKNIIRLGRCGKTATWVIPAAITLVDVSAAAPGEKVHTASRDTGGIVLGAAGGAAGAIVGGAIVVALGLSGAGAILVVALCVGAGSYGGSEIGINITDKILKIMGW